MPEVAEVPVEIEMRRARVQTRARAVSRRLSFAVLLVGCGVSPPPAPPNTGDGGGLSGCGAAPDGGLVDGSTFVPLDGGPGSSVTVAWTLHGQPGSGSTCLGNSATRLWSVVAILAAVPGQPGGYHHSQSERPRLDPRCAAGSLTFPSVIGGCYTVTASLVELRPDNLPTGTVLSAAAVVTVPVGSTAVRVTVAFAPR